VHKQLRTVAAANWTPATTVVTSAAPHDDGAAGAPRDRSPQRTPQLPGGAAVAGFVSAAGSGGMVLFGLLGFLFLLAIPNAVRLLRPVSALGMTPAYVALSDRPG
jgi:hypothetical protein